ncbi:hypothetical protein B0H15DRAFT_363652 [Mycena belliarum]|uniref:Uncharacterized protein n=1 Tax=Mycena belliarum TaxID=1033014 RepID=A0AAD6U0M1_9AGAR|nr:hypothetical protein B0H15DRAFT_363652 [Mycena belliae]
MCRTGMDRLGSGTRCPRYLVAPASLDRHLPCPLKTTTTASTAFYHHHHHRLHSRKGHNAKTKMHGRPWTLRRPARRGMWPIRLRPTLACGWTHFNAGSVCRLGSFRNGVGLVLLVLSWFLVVVVRPFCSLPSAPTAVASRRQGTPRPQALCVALSTPTSRRALHTLFTADHHFKSLACSRANKTCRMCPSHRRDPKKPYIVCI